MRFRLLLLTLVGCLLPCQNVNAAAFSVFQIGARAAGMATAFAAIADDGSAIFYNPAGIAFQKGLRVQMDGFLLKGLFHYFPSSVPPGTIVPQDGYNGSVSPKLLFLGNLYMSKDISKKWTVGFGMFAPYGLGDNWTSFKDSDPTNTKFVGRFAGTRGLMQVMWFEPVIAYRLSENSSIAVGAAAVYNHLLLEQSLLNPYDDGKAFGKLLAPLLFNGQPPDLIANSIARMLPEVRSRIAGTGIDPGWSVGYLYKHRQYKTNFGIMYRSAVVHHITGKASFAVTDNYPLKTYIGADKIPSLFPTQAALGSLVTPGNFSIGVANSSFWNSIISAEFQFQDYHRFKSVALNFTKTIDTATPPELRLNFDFNNAYEIKLGMEKKLGDMMHIRAGYYFDHSPVPPKSVGPLFPDSTHNSFTTGFSREMGNKEFTLFYEAVKWNHITTNVAENAVKFTNGEYRSFAHIIGFGIRMNLGATSIRTDK
jgi:long-chain fatty acid transport protein